MTSPGTSRKRSLLAQERSRETRKAIVKAALELWSERGYDTGIDDTTAGEIASRAGVSKATFYLHFARKEDVLLETGWVSATVFYSDAVAALSVSGSPVDAVLDDVTVRLCRRMSKVPRPVLRRILRAQAGSGVADEQPRADDDERFGFRRAFTLIFSEAVSSGDLPSAIPPGDLGGIFEAMLYASLREWAYDETADLLTMVRQRFGLLLGGARPGSSPGASLLRGSRSCRFFSPDPVPRDLVESIVETARWAGSARNAQPWRFAAVTSAAARESLSRLGAYAQHLAGAPLVLVLLEPSPGTRDTQFDLGRVTQNLALAASDAGLGSCVATFYPSSNAEAAASVAGFGDGWVARHALAIGWPARSDLAGRPAIPGGRMPVSELLFWR